MSVSVCERWRVYTYLEQLIVCRLRLQFAALVDGLFEGGGLGDHGEGLQYYVDGEGVRSFVGVGVFWCMQLVLWWF